MQFSSVGGMHLVDDYAIIGIKINKTMLIKEVPSCLFT